MKKHKKKVVYYPVYAGTVINVAPHPACAQPSGGPSSGPNLGNGSSGPGPTTGS